MKTLAEGIVTVHDNASEQLSKVNPFILIGASIAGTWIIFRVREEWKNERPIYKRFLNN
jgi:uncharacterized membrane protein YraQ (UPF0718 family)